MTVRSSLCLTAAAAAMPRGLMGSPRAEGSDAAEVLSKLNSAFTDFRKRHDGRVDAIEASVDKLLESNAGFRLGGLGEGAASIPSDPEYSSMFASYVRSGDNEGELRRQNSEGYRAQVNAAMSGGTPSEGGYIAPTEWDRNIRKAMRETSPIRRMASIVVTGVQAYSTVWSDGLWGSGWVGETAARPATTTPTFQQLEFAHGEIYANAAITQRLLDDSEINVEEWLNREVKDEFARQEGMAFVAGNGVNKPRGFLTYVDGGASDGRHPGGNLTVVASGAADTLTADGLLDFAYSLPAPHRQGAAWIMNSSTAAVIAKMKDGNESFIWREGLVAGQPSTLLGYPVEIDEAMPNVAPDALPVAFGNFSDGYVVNDRLGTQVLRDPFTNKPFVQFYCTKRVGGGVLDPNAIRLLRVAAAA